MTARKRETRFAIVLVADHRPVLSLRATDILEAEEEAAELLGLTLRALFARELGPVRPARPRGTALGRRP